MRCPGSHRVRKRRTGGDFCDRTLDKELAEPQYESIHS